MAYRGRRARPGTPAAFLCSLLTTGVWLLASGCAGGGGEVAHGVPEPGRPDAAGLPDVTGGADPGADTGAPPDRADGGDGPGADLPFGGGGTLWTRIIADPGGLADDRLGMALSADGTLHALVDQGPHFG